MVGWALVAGRYQLYPFVSKTNFTVHLVYNGINILCFKTGLGCFEIIYVTME